MFIHENISLNDRVVQGKGNIVSDMGGEKVMLSVSNGKYYNLGAVGGNIWGLIHSPISISKVIETLTLNYDVEESMCQQQVLVFLEQLLKEGLIEKQ